MPFTIPAILGPTGVGKSAAAFALAQATGAEIISCDSRCIYCGLDIGTAKPMAAERSVVVHHMIDCVDPDEEFSAYRFAEEASRIIADRLSHGVKMILCGGTGFYFSALRDGTFSNASYDPDFRARCMALAAREGGVAELFGELTAADPAAAARLHMNDIHRVIRALHVAREKNNPSGPVEKSPEMRLDVCFDPLILTSDRETLYARINNRVTSMAADGLYDEFLALRRKGYDETAPGMHTVGYQELFAVERGESSLDAALDLIRQSSRRYAKRQMTWFTNKTPGRQIVADDVETVVKTIRESCRF